MICDCVLIVSVRGEMLRDASDGATVYVDLCIDSTTGVSCHDVDSRSVSVLNQLLLET